MKHFWRFWIGILLLSMLSFVLVGASAESIHAAASTTTFWLQTVDSCREAIPGASYVLQGNGLDIPEGPAPGSKPVKVADGNCLIQRCNCITVPTGCLSWQILIPASGTATYTITETTSPSNYAICVGGSACSVPETVTLTIDATGAISATVKNVYPNGQTITWPTSGPPYTGSQTDPAVTHNSRIGTGNCDGDSDADDHMTGSEGNSPHCDNDTDRG